MPESGSDPLFIAPDVVERARSGDPHAHAELYHAFAPMVYTVARRMLGSASLAEDVVQDSFVEVIRKAGQFRGEAEVGHWIRRIAINKCLSQLRSPWARRRIDVPDGDAANDPAVAAGGSLDRTRVERELSHRLELERAFEALSPMARAVVWLHDVEGYTHREIGRRMGRTTSFSKTQLMRAHEKMRAVLQPEITEEEIEPCLTVLKIV